MKRNQIYIALSFIVGFIIAAGTASIIGYLPRKCGAIGIISGILVMTLRLLFIEFIVPWWNKLSAKLGL